MDQTKQTTKNTIMYDLFLCFKIRIHKKKLDLYLRKIQISFWGKKIQIRI